MRTSLVSLLVVLAQWGMPANAQPQAGALPASRPAATNGYLSDPLTRRLLFFPSPAGNMGRQTLFGPAARAPRTGSFLKPGVTHRAPQYLTPPTLKFRPTGLLPLDNQPEQDLRRFLRPNRNSRLFFFGKPQLGRQ